MFKQCPVCKKSFSPHTFPEGRKESLSYFRIRFHCSNRCRGKSWVGANHPRWKGGTWVSKASGYIINSRTNRPVHRLVIEQHLGRKLRRYEVVHHINHNRQDNRIKNLQLMTWREHAKHHSRHQGNRIGKHYGTEPSPKYLTRNGTLRLLSTKLYYWRRSTRLKARLYRQRNREKIRRRWKDYYERNRERLSKHQKVCEATGRTPVPMEA